MMNKGLFNWSWLLVTWMIPVSVICQPAASSPVMTINEIAGDPCLRTAGLSLVVLDLDSDSIVEKISANRALPPASTLKILTTAAALRVLGPDFRFITLLGYTGKVLNDTLMGDLIIKGLGDPTLGSAHFRETGFDQTLVRIGTGISSEGISHITGRIVADASFHEITAIPRTWPYQDMGNYYGAFCTGLNFHDNQYFLDFFQKSVPGLPVDQLRIRPEVPGLQHKSYVTTGSPGSGDQAYIMGAPFQLNRYIQGTIPPGRSVFTIRGSLPDPALFCAEQVRRHLERTGITISHPSIAVYTTPAGTDHWTDTLYSPLLRQIVDVTNQKSVNLFAEGLGLQLSHFLPKQKEHSLINYWAGRGVNMEGCRFSDYSGLAPDNALTGSAMVQVLRDIYHDDRLWPVFFESLAVMGESGTLQHMMKNTPARAKIYAKSGLINGVRNFAGYLQSSSGQWYAFSLMTFNPDCDAQQVRKKLEQLLETLYLSLL